MALLAVTVLIASCAHTKTYVEPSLPPEKAPILEVLAPVWLISVDGEKIRSRAWRADRRIKISPGPHVIEVSYAGYEIETRTGGGRSETRQHPVLSTDSVKLRFIAREGRVYMVNDGKEGEHWRPSVGEFLPFK